MDELNAYADLDTEKKPTGSGVLSGTRFAVKDVIGVEGHKNGAGNPDWLKTAAPAHGNAPVIDRLLGHGAYLKGMTLTDEMMYSLNGENYHYGTPLNPKAPERIPGGSSSGSASVTAAGKVDFAIGTDTGGSVRIPASYCGLYGFRPTHGALPMEGVIPLAGSFDTIGWMARTPQMMQKVGNALLQNDKDGIGFERVILPDEAWELVDNDQQSLYAEALSSVRGTARVVETTKLAGEGLQVWADTFRTMQALEIWQEHGEWIQQNNPSFGPDIKERFAWAATLDQSRYDYIGRCCKDIQEYLDAVLGKKTVLLLPTTPGGAPLRNLPMAEMNDRRAKMMQLTAVAGLGGLPQLTIPVFGRAGLPAGLSVVAGRYQDQRLLNWAPALAENIKKI